MERPKRERKIGEGKAGGKGGALAMGGENRTISRENAGTRQRGDPDRELPTSGQTTQKEGGGDVKGNVETRQRRGAHRLDRKRGVNLTELD